MTLEQASEEALCGASITRGLDEAWILHKEQSAPQSELMLVENFH